LALFGMSPDRLIVEAIKAAQHLLRQNLPPMHNLTDAATVLRLRELVHSSSIRSALDRSSDTLLAFACGPSSGRFVIIRGLIAKQ